MIKQVRPPCHQRRLYEFALRSNDFVIDRRIANNMSDLKQRVITALGLVAGLGVVLFSFSTIAAMLAFMVIAACAAWEWGGLMRQDQPARIMYAFVLLLFCWQVYIFAATLTPVLLMIAVVFWLTIVPFWLWRQWKLSGNDFFGYLMGVLVILPTWAAMMFLYSVSPWVLLATMAIVWVADIGAYFTGRAFGRHKLAPTISPGKTWEGVAGALLGVGVYGLCLLVYSPAKNTLHWGQLTLILLLLTAVSVLGDLFESLLKRQVGIKDSSGLLPGHGGVLDRIDSLTSTLPLAAALLYFFI
jgi:phosphatidate cytidylyltransferase